MPPLQLYIRSGDPQAVKACIAAALTDTQLEIKQENKSQLRDQAPLFYSESKICLLISETEALTEPNVIAEFIGGEKLIPKDSELSLYIREWSDWEASVLRGCVYSGNEQEMKAALEKISKQIAGGRQYLVGDLFSLADVVVYSTLLPLKLTNQLPEDVSNYVKTLEAQNPSIQQGLNQALILEQSETKFSQIYDQDVHETQQKANQIKLPIKGQRNILVTSALPYVNNVPHLGNIIGCVLSADAYARYCRQRGYNTIFVCGTDEYGTATETKAYEEGLTCQQICDKYHAIHKEIYEWFQIGFDRFGRTPTRFQTQIAQTMFNQLDERGYLVEQEQEQLFSEALGKFLSDRLVIGTCPKCTYEDARGDQCDNCQTLLNPQELINPKCKLTGTTPVSKITKHMFIDLPKLTEELQDYITKTSELGGWSANCVQVTNSWMKQGLKIRSITRDLVWGTPVPKPGYEKKVMYVWFDAPIGYLSITAGLMPNNWQDWWKNPDEVELVQFMGKDNVPFHTVIFPATLLGTGDKWTMMKNISVTEYLNYEGGKFSKSRGVGVFGTDARDTGIPVEVWRYYLLSNRPEQSDTDFKWSDLQAKNNSELLNNFGNFVFRALSFLYREDFFGGVAPVAHESKGIEQVEELGKAVGPMVQDYIDTLDRIKIREGIFTALRISAEGNKFFQDHQPWVLIKKDKEHCGTLILAAVGLVRVLAALVFPYMPSISNKLVSQLNLKPEQIQLTNELIEGAFKPHTLVPSGHKMSPEFKADKVKDTLFATIPDARIAELRARYSGQQDEQAPSKGDKKGGKGGGANNGKTDGKKKKEKNAPANGDAPVDISRLDLRVGLIRRAWKHPNAESLYAEEVEVGEEKPRSVVSGLVKFIPEEEMQNRRVVLICNLPAREMRGVKSEAMVLAATSVDGNTVELVEPPEGSQIGERISVEGFSGEPDTVLNPKKKVFETVQVDLATNEAKLACYKGKPLLTQKGPCSVKSVVGGSIK
eukprot:TRINITY_DN6435_c0_g1_i5.p1 TRINITY_DN6435_c0_g1~~TRINITY_DN6435_c0_g1_i5.p1  ORF type:complete len:1024 (-),score=164.90 TRINITY_DN6435_c0_g1_i5:327-3305(-)